MNSMNVAVLMGGVSREREVSLRSGKAVAGALWARGHGVKPIIVNDVEARDLVKAAPTLDAAFIALHGRFGEDGGVQRLCEELRLPYTGSGPAASALALDKVAAKRRFEAAGIPTPAWRTLDPRTALDLATAAVSEHPCFPCVVKPVDEGSSIGVSVVESEKRLGFALALIRELGAEALVEELIGGRELTVGILGSTPLVPIELRPKRAFYDYRAKYDRGAGTEYIVDPELPAGVGDLVRDIARKAHETLGCEGMSRVDIRLDEEDRPFVLEVNTVPGFTGTSLLPKAAWAAGLSFADLCERVLESAIVRGVRKPHPATPARPPSPSPSPTSSPTSPAAAA
jgi:D-alanine-D-alanine ligase